MSSMTSDVRLPTRQLSSTGTGVCRTPSRRSVLVPLGLVISVVAVIVLVVLGSSRMIDATAGVTDSSGQHPVGYGLSVQPLGFTVHWSNGSDETHLWW